MRRVTFGGSINRLGGRYDTLINYSRTSSILHTYLLAVHSYVATVRFGHDVCRQAFRPNVCDDNPTLPGLISNDVIPNINVLRLCQPKRVIDQMIRAFVVLVHNHPPLLLVGNIKRSYLSTFHKNKTYPVQSAEKRALLHMN